MGGQSSCSEVALGMDWVGLARPRTGKVCTGLGPFIRDTGTVTNPVPGPVDKGGGHRIPILVDRHCLGLMVTNSTLFFNYIVWAAARHWQRVGVDSGRFGPSSGLGPAGPRLTKGEARNRPE
ncbi:unnamed protein product [Cuscuta epithymum]|uniref:Uncharacterized protein n=1 Tax=Cuscuta epithymum TaxID=186058 RepID=A0AAV0C362_9ASTE|nr:unnamed protein product [Cuscuta epithymum]